MSLLNVDILSPVDSLIDNVVDPARSIVEPVETNNKAAANYIVQFLFEVASMNSEKLKLSKTSFKELLDKCGVAESVVDDVVSSALETSDDSVIIAKSEFERVLVNALSNVSGDDGTVVVRVSDLVRLFSKDKKNK